MEDLVQQRRRRLAEDADKIVDAIDAELRRTEHGIAEDQLELARRKIRTAGRFLRSDGHMPEAQHRDLGLCRLVIDSWPLGSKIGNMVSEFEAAFKMI